MRVGWRILSALIVLPASAGPPAPLNPTPSPPDDVQFIVSEAQQVQETDVAAWARYRFGRRAQREDYDDSGRVVERDDLEFVVTPDEDGFREELVRHNGT